MAKPRVLLSAYACEPDRGSEPAVGWNFAVAAAKECEVWVVTRANNRGAIEKKAEAVSVHWVYYDLPSWGLFLKKHLRMTSLYYLLWQVGVQKTIRRVCRANEIDVIHHVTFGSALLPPMERCGKIPLIWGPVGGLGSVPFHYYRYMSFFGKLKELFHSALVFLSSRMLIPLHSHRINKVITVSETSMTKMPESLRENGLLMSQVGLDETTYSCLRSISAAGKAAPFTVMMTGRFVQWKGFALGIAAFATFAKQHPDAELCIVGDGSEADYLYWCAMQSGFANKITFTGFLDKEQYQKMLSTASVTLFPSFHEPGAFVVAESLAAGVPVICFDGNEPASLTGVDAGLLIRVNQGENPEAKFAEALSVAYARQASSAEIASVCRRCAEKLLWDKRLHGIASLYSSVISANSK